MRGWTSRRPVCTMGEIEGFMADKDLIQHLSDATFTGEVKTGVTLVDFHAEWCGPCRMLAPVLEQVAKDVKGKAKVAKIDIDKEQKTASQYNITSVPTIILFKDGKEVNRLVGLRNADAIKQFVLAAV